MRLTDYFIQKGVITEGDVPAILADAKKSKGGVEEVLVKYGITSTDIFDAKAILAGIETRHVGDAQVAFEVLSTIPEESAIHYKIAPIGIKDGALEVGVVDPDNLEARDALGFISVKTGMPYVLYLITEEDHAHILELYKNLSGEVTKAVSELETTAAIHVDTSDSAESANLNKTQIIEDAPVAKIVNTILRYAVEGKASDVHIEPMQDRIRVRFRLDGDLKTSLILPKKLLDPLVARIKIMTQTMKLDEKRRPQDASFYAMFGKDRVDFRVSTLPSVDGEKVVMRILDPSRGVKSLESIGMTERNLKAIRAAITRPYGLILISGPTGSGKSTTLYAMMGEINDDAKNIMSLEDPVEYRMQGVNQSQMHSEIGYTFANGLRTALRQDPDIIMVGEIRDKETAQLAIQAALTGHLVLSTIHTNSAIGVIPRLVDMGVDPYLIAPTLICAIAQRLVARIAPGAGKEEVLDEVYSGQMQKQFSDLPEEFKKDVPFTNAILRAEPTADYPTGTKGRAAVIEVLDVDRDVQRAILHSPTEEDIWKIARKKGMLTLKEDAYIKAFKKEIPFEEVLRL
jgi:type IV pilus assembly protein PilB